jgi:hypothetical protein
VRNTRRLGDQGVCKMHKYSLYETAVRYYIVGADVMDNRFRILKIDREADAGNLTVSRRRNCVHQEGDEPAAERD